MAGDRPAPPKVASVRTTIVDDAWDDGSDAAVEDPLPRAGVEDAAVRPPTRPRPPPGPPEPPGVDEVSVIEVDSLLDAVDDDVDATLATVRRADLEPMLGAPPPDASPYRPLAPPVHLPQSAPAPRAEPPVHLPQPAPAPRAEPPVAAPAAPPEPPPRAPAPAAPVPAPAALPEPPPAPASAASPVGVTPPYAQVDLRYTGEPAASLVGGAPGVGAALGLKVRLAGAEVPMWLPVVLATAVAGVCCVVLGFALGRAGRSASPALGAAPPVAPSAAPAGSVPPVPTSLVERASAGDTAALEKLEGQPALDANALLAVSHGRMMQRRQKLDKLGARLQQKPALAAERTVRKQLISAARDPETSRQALRIMATLRSSEGPDLLYQTWTGTPRRTEATRLAEALVHEKEIRARATPALAVALDLRDAKSCEDDQKLLAAAKDHGDRRSLHQLALLQRRFGCGPRKKQDCYECLRDGDDLVDAIKAVRRRPGPRF